MARDYPKEINKKYNNLYQGKDRWEQLSLRVDYILESIDEIRKIESFDIQAELLKGSFIGIVSCIEGYMRLAIRDIIDHSEVFSLRADHLKIPNKKILGQNDNLVSKGDLISHTISINNLNLLNDYFSILLDIDFLETIKISPVSDDIDIPVNEYNSDFFADISLLFEYRNMFAHELASDIYVDLDGVDYLVSVGFLFIHITEEIVDCCLFETA